MSESEERTTRIGSRGNMTLSFARDWNFAVDSGFAVRSVFVAMEVMTLRDGEVGRVYDLVLRKKTTESGSAKVYERFGVCWSNTLSRSPDWAEKQVVIK